MPESFQERFHRRWRHLNDPHVRALAWLLDSPDLLDPAAPRWQGRIASLHDAAAHAQSWLAGLDRDPAALHAYLDVQPFSRLGRYAEKLLAYYFTHSQTLVAYGVQVRLGKNETIGEFDFLLQTGGGLAHWEFATKFYLLQPQDAAGEGEPKPDYFVGPNLADTLGAKMNKILTRQLSLSAHPAAQAYLPQPVHVAQALVKGWLFYRRGEAASHALFGVSAAHCRGFWCDLEEAQTLDAACFAVLPRLRWMAPARMPLDEAMDRRRLLDGLNEHFRTDSMPVLVALLAERDGGAVEIDRGFIVPVDWRRRAVERSAISLAARN